MVLKEAGHSTGHYNEPELKKKNVKETMDSLQDIYVCEAFQPHEVKCWR